MRVSCRKQRSSSWDLISAETTTRFRFFRTNTSRSLVRTRCTRVFTVLSVWRYQNTLVFRPDGRSHMQVREVMSRDVLVTSPDDTIEKAATLMGQVDCGALPVGDNDRLVGIVTDRDITLRAVAKGNPPDR